MAGRQIIHLDLDAFFAAVEQRDDPRLRGRPVVVGGPRRRGVVAAASYEARRFGVRSAMPIAEALRRCSRLVVVAPRREAYAAASAQVFAIFARYTPLVEGLSIDEAFLDVSASRRLFGDGETIAREIKAAVRREVQLTISAGVAPNKFVAKIASDLGKPDGLVTVADAEVARFLAPLPLERMWGVGPKAAARLRAAGMGTIGDLARASPAHLEALLGSWGPVVHQLAGGVDDRPVEPFTAQKSVGAEETFAIDRVTAEELEPALLEQAQRVAHRLWQENLCGRVVTLKLKWADFQLQTRRVCLPEPVFDTDAIYAAARRLLAGVPLGRRGVRLTGVAVSDLSAGPPPPVLFPDRDRQRRERLERASNAIRERFGDERLVRATLLDGQPAERGGVAQVAASRAPRVPVAHGELKIPQPK